MSEGIVAALYALLLTSACGVGVQLAAQRRSGGVPARLPVATIIALVVVGVPSLLQLTLVPALLEHLGRDRAAIGAGQVWRLVTALVVQDGGVPGTVFNLVALALVGAVAEQIWGPAQWVVVALGAGVAAQLWGLVVQPTGAGNSVAVFGLAASVAVVALVSGDRAIRAGAVASLALGVVLLVTGDIHGGAALVGAVLGIVLTRAGRRPPASGDPPTVQAEPGR